MARVMVVGDDILLRIWCSDNEQASVNSIWYKVAAVGSPPATDQDFANQFEPFLAPLYKAMMSNNALYRGVQVSEIPPVPTPPFATVFQNGTAGPGTAGAAALPRQTCGMLSFQTNQAGRAFRGRMYMPFPAAADDTGDGIPTNGYVTQLSVIGADLSVGISVVQGGRTATLVRILKHRKNKDGIIPPDTPVVSYSVKQRWGTQRRRGSYGRANSAPI